MITKFLATVIVAITVPMTFAAPAEAFRPGPGYVEVDYCKNIPGMQAIDSLIYRRVILVGKSGKCKYFDRRTGTYVFPR